MNRRERRQQAREDRAVLKRMPPGSVIEDGGDLPPDMADVIAHAMQFHPEALESTEEGTFIDFTKAQWHNEDCGM